MIARSQAPSKPPRTVVGRTCVINLAPGRPGTGKPVIEIREHEQAGRTARHSRRTVPERAGVVDAGRWAAHRLQASSRSQERHNFQLPSSQCPLQRPFRAAHSFASARPNPLCRASPFPKGFRIDFEWFYVDIARRSRNRLRGPESPRGRNGRDGRSRRPEAGSSTDLRWHFRPAPRRPMAFVQTCGLAANWRCASPPTPRATMQGGRIGMRGGKGILKKGKRTGTSWNA